MVRRRDLIRGMAAAGAIPLAGCEALSDGADGESPTDRTETTVLRPTRTTTATPTATPTPTVSELVGTPAYGPVDSIDEFGKAVALSAETAIVVAEEHGAYVFEAADGAWTNSTVLAPTGGEDFGGHVPAAALVGDRAVVGGPQAEAAFLFSRADGAWAQRNRFAAADSDRGEFGRSVAVDGDRVVVGAAHDPTTMVPYLGSAFVFAGDGTDWTREASLTTDAQDLFGTAVAVDGETVLVGAPFASPGDRQTGAVYAYRRRDGSWARDAVLSPSDAQAEHNSRFGHAVALDGETAVVGAPNGGDGTGRAVVFERRAAGWTEGSTLAAPAVGDGAAVGRSVAIADGTVVVGAPEAHGPGRAYAYTAGDGWADVRRLRPADAHEDAAFGASVALSDGTALVGAPALDAATGTYLFDL